MHLVRVRGRSFPDSMITRRRFLAAGVVGTVALATAGWWAWSRRAVTTGNVRALSSDALAIVTAIVPAMLAGALPGDTRARATAVTETVAGVDEAVAGLPPAAQTELGQLFTLLAMPPARRAFAGVATPWEEASVDEVAAFLDRWHDSRWALKRSAYDALHQLIVAAWYGNPRSWSVIGYDGPPQLGA